jgi:type VI protein secretion system component VasK
MYGLVMLLWNGLKKLAGLFHPVFARARDWRRYSTPVRWVLHFALIALVLVGLGFLNYYFDLERYLRTPLPILRKVWLPLLFLLVYVNIWLGWWLWRLLGPDKETSEFPDLDTAWEKALAELDRAGIALDRVPLFLVLGRSAGPEAALFQASGLKLAVHQAPSPDAPLHVHAGGDGIFVTCPDTSLLGRHAAALAPSPGAGPSAESAGPEQAASPRPFVLKEGGVTEVLTARLKHVCALIARDRRPYCPLNGVLVLSPFATVDSDVEANRTAAVCQQDLLAAEEVFQVRCPVLILFTDMDRAAGAGDFIARFPAEARDRRIGRPFPYVSDMDAAHVPEMLAGGMAWACQELMPRLVYRVLRPGQPGGEDPAATVRGNARLYHFLSNFRRRQAHLTRLLTRAFVRPRGLTWLAGCYFAATGADRAEQAFVGGVFQQLVEGQNFVAWSPEALAEEKAYSRLARFGYVCLGLFAAAVVILAVLL